MEIKSIGIIGFGDFGRFLFSLAKEHVPQLPVKVHSSRREPDGTDFFPLEEVCKTDMLLICVPIAAFAETIDTILPLLGDTTIVVDVATVKTHTAAILKEKNIPRYIATHPMFGPYSYVMHGNSLKDLRIAVCDTSLDRAEMVSVLEFLRAADLKVLELSADRHDRLVAETLFLTHLIGQTIKRGGFERTAIDTVSFGFLMNAVESVAHDDALFRDVYKYNPYCKEVVARLEKAEADIKASLTAIA